MRISMGSSLTMRRAPPPKKSLVRGDREAVVVAVAAQKGGVGKTTTSSSLAAAWARFFGKRVLLIDLDPQGHVNLALREQVHVGGGALSDVLADPRANEVEEISTSTTVDDLFVTPPDPGLLGAEDRLSSRIGKELLLKKGLEITRSHYDIIIIDCPPNVGTLTVNALVAADQVLIPVNPAALALAGVSGLMGTIDEIRADLNPHLEICGVALTRLDSRNSRTNEAVLELVRDNFGDELLPVSIGVSNALAEAQLAGQDIYSFKAGSRGAEQYRELAAVVLERLEG
jgi:chromosome partitioning protein